MTKLPREKRIPDKPIGDVILTWAMRITVIVVALVLIYGVVRVFQLAPVWHP